MLRQHPRVIPEKTFGEFFAHRTDQLTPYLELTVALFECSSPVGYPSYMFYTCVPGLSYYRT